MGGFGDRLGAAIVAKRNPVMAGIDPRWEILPPSLQESAVATHGPTLEAVAAGFETFCRGILDVVTPKVPIVKFQTAFFEQIGPAGMATLGRLLAYAQAADVLVVVDGKRNDIGSTAQAYAEGYLGEMTVGKSTLRPWQADALTVNPLLGEEGITPFLETAQVHHAGLFVLVRTSNPGAGQLQDQTLGDGRTVYQLLADWVENWSAPLAKDTAQGYGPVGAVVGATVPAQVAELRQRMPHAIMLLPGYGAQGGTAADTAAAFDSRGLGAVINNSRGLMFAYRDQAYAGMAWPDATAAATDTMIAALRAQTPAGRL